MKKPMPKIELSALDQERFGIITAKAYPETIDDIEGINLWCQHNNVALVIARIATTNLRLAQSMEEYSYKLMDTLVYYQSVSIPQGSASDLLPLDYKIFEQRRPTRVEMHALANEAFRNYHGHYHSDARIDPIQADAVYTSWADRSAQDSQVAQHILTIYRSAPGGGEALAAFATLNERPRGMEGVLFCVHPNDRGKGLHRALVRASIKYSTKREFPIFFSSTQITNVEVQKNWAREGMLPSQSFYTFHLWRS